MTRRSEQDVKELKTFERFLTEYAANKELEKTVGRKLPLATITVPNEWWDPKGQFQKSPEDKAAPQCP